MDKLTKVVNNTWDAAGNNFSEYRAIREMQYDD
jgi:hypothetical protein